MSYLRRTGRSLLLTFDAFNTLYTPKESIAKQYLDVAGRFGIKGIKVGDIERTLRSAIKLERSLSPNYGVGSGGTSDSWWTSVVRNTFLPHVPSTLHAQLDPLARALVKHFSSGEGYLLYKDVIPFLRRIRTEYDDRYGYDELSVGVISNSDDRVLKILPSLGIAIPDKAAAAAAQKRIPSNGAEATAILDLVVLSCDVGHEKPSPWIFCHALASAAAAAGRVEMGGGGFKEWTCVHVGDDVGKDLMGASRMGWRAIHLQRDPETAAAPEEGFAVINDLSQLWGHLGRQK